MNRFKFTLSLFLALWLFVLPISFGATQSLSLEEAITLSKEHSAVIRSVLNQDFNTQNTIRKNIQNSYQLENVLDTYYDYIEIYNQVVDSDNEHSTIHPWYRYIGKSNDELTKLIGTQHPVNPLKSTGLMKKIVMATLTGQTEKVKLYKNEIAFISMYMAFGDNPSLTKDLKYEKFKKNEAMLKNSVDLINTKYAQGLTAATKRTEAGIIKLYVGIKNIEHGLKVKNEVLKTYETSLKNMENAYKQGLVSKIAYENQQHTVAIKRLETENLQFRHDNLLYQLKKMCAIPMETTVKLSTTFGNNDYTLNAPSTYLETAYSNNGDLNNLNAELTYTEKNLAVMNKYLDDRDWNKDFTKPIYHQEKVDTQEKIDELNQQIAHKKHLIEANLIEAYNDLLLKKKKLNYNKDLLTLSEAQVNKGIQSWKLGQITQLQLDQLKLQHANTLMIIQQNVRAYNTGIENFKLLVDYGVTYQ